MFCEKCGGENSETAKFCRKCGAGIGDEVETSVAVRARDQAPPPQAINRDGETPIFSITPTLLFVKIAYVVAGLAAVLLVAAVAAYTPLPVWIAVVAGMLLFLVPASFHFKRKIIRYTLTAS